MSRRRDGRPPAIRRAGATVTLLAIALLGAGTLQAASDEPPFLVVLGIAQDGGFPQAGSESPAWDDPSLRRLVSSLAVVDPTSGERFLFDATPDLKWQLHDLDRTAPSGTGALLDGIFLTHAHTGHYMGLIHLGKEMAGAAGVPVWAMPRMEAFLRTNAPFRLYVDIGNLEIRSLRAREPVQLNPRLRVTPIPVPHRDEFSETIGFVIEGPHRSVFFLPDIDKWEAWDELDGPRAIERVLERVDLAYLDGTFYADGEVPGRAMSEIRHPFISESVARFEPELAAKIRFIHLNRTNPAILPDSSQRRDLLALGFRLAAEGERQDL